MAQERNGVSAVFFPSRPESTVAEEIEKAAGYLKPGLRIYTNGHQLAVLPGMLPGWSAFMAR
jgi:hypothetical protein